MNLEIISKSSPKSSPTLHFRTDLYQNQIISMTLILLFQKEYSLKRSAVLERACLKVNDTLEILLLMGDKMSRESSLKTFLVAPFKLDEEILSENICMICYLGAN